MALDFPTPTTVGQIFTQGSLTYVWDGTKWVGQAPGATVQSKIEKGNTSAEVVDTGSDGQFKVTTEGAQRVTVDSSGVGIGTSSVDANSRLHIAKDSATKIRIERTGSAPSLNDIGTASNALYLSNNVAGIQFLTGTTPSERLRLDSLGNVYIGGTSAATADIALNANGSATFGNGTVELAQNSGITIDDGAIDLYSATSNGNAKPFKVQSDVGGTKVEKASISAGGNASFSGTVTANAFSGDGSALTNLPAAGVSLGLAIALG